MFSCSSDYYQSGEIINNGGYCIKYHVYVKVMTENVHLVKVLHFSMRFSHRPQSLGLPGLT